MYSSGKHNEYEEKMNGLFSLAGNMCGGERHVITPMIVAEWNYRAENKERRHGVEMRKPSLSS